MSTIANILRPYAITDLNLVKEVTKTSFKEWVIKYPQVLDTYIAEDKEYIFYINDTENCLKSVAFDISRMSIAAFETIHAISSSNELINSTAWPLIRSYYAAFFAAHTIMRIFGYAVIQLESQQIAKLNLALNFCNPPPPASAKIGEGLHLVKFNLERRVFTLSKLNNGSHEDTWQVLANVLDMISRKMLTDQNPISNQLKQVAYEQLQQLISIMRTFPCSSRSNWLSRIRNEINYQHKYGTWFPHEKAKGFKNNIFDNIKNWKKEPNILVHDTTHPLDKFSKACVFLISLSKEMICDIDKRNPDNRSFLKNSVVKVINFKE